MQSKKESKALDKWSLESSLQKAYQEGRHLTFNNARSKDDEKWATSLPKVSQSTSTGYKMCKQTSNDVSKFTNSNMQKPKEYKFTNYSYGNAFSSKVGSINSSFHNPQLTHEMQPKSLASKPCAIEKHKTPTLEHSNHIHSEIKNKKPTPKAFQNINTKSYNSHSESKMRSANKLALNTANASKFTSSNHPQFQKYQTSTNTYADETKINIQMNMSKIKKDLIVGNQPSAIYKDNILSQKTKKNWCQSNMKVNDNFKSTNLIMESALNTLRSWQRSSIIHKPPMPTHTKAPSMTSDNKTLFEQALNGKETIPVKVSKHISITKKNQLSHQPSCKFPSNKASLNKATEKFIRYKGVEYKIIKSPPKHVMGNVQPKIKENDTSAQNSGNVLRHSPMVHTTDVISICEKRTSLSQIESSPISLYSQGIRKVGNETICLYDGTAKKDPLQVDDALSENCHWKQQDIVNLSKGTDSVNVEIKKRKYKRKPNRTGFPTPRKKVKKDENVTPEATARISQSIEQIVQLHKQSKTKMTVISRSLKETPNIGNSVIRPTLHSKTSDSNSIKVPILIKQKYVKKISKPILPNQIKKSKNHSCKKSTIDVTTCSINDKDSDHETVADVHKYYELLPLTDSTITRVAAIKLKRINKADHFIDGQDAKNSRCTICSKAGRKFKIRKHIEKDHSHFVLQDVTIKTSLTSQHRAWRHLSSTKDLYMRIYQKDIENFVMKPLLVQVIDDSVKRVLLREKIKKLVIEPVMKHLFNRSYRMILGKEKSRAKVAQFRREKAIKLVIKPTVSRIFNEAMKIIRAQTKLQHPDIQNNMGHIHEKMPEVKVRIKIVVAIQCTICTKEFENRNQLSQHMRDRHNQDLQRHIANKERELKKERPSTLLQYYCFRSQTY